MGETLGRQQISVFYTIAIFIIILFSGQVIAETTTYHWEIDEVLSEQETVFVPQPIEVEIEGTDIKTSISDSSSLKLAEWYRVYLSPEWDANKAYLLLQALQDMSRFSSA